MTDRRITVSLTYATDEPLKSFFNGLLDALTTHDANHDMVIMGAHDWVETESSDTNADDQQVVEQ